MTTVFVAGSRRISRLGKPVLERLDNIMGQGHAVVVGDANGVDKAVQDYLAAKAYPKVEIYCSGTLCRHNLGGWPVRSVPLLQGKRGFESYATRDLAMAQQAGVGFFIWDGRSKGTHNNILNMLKLEKKSLVFFPGVNRFVTIRASEDLSQLQVVAQFGPASRETGAPQQAQAHPEQAAWGW